MKILFIWILTFVSILLFAYSISKRIESNKENEALQHEIVMLAYKNGYLSGFNNCRKDSSVFIESSFQKDSLIVAKIVYR